MTEQRQVQQRAIPRLKNLDPTPSHSFCPVNRAQSNIAAAASAAHCSSSSPVTSGGVAPCCAQLQVSRNSHSASHAWSFPGPRVNSQTRGQVHQVDREGGMIVMRSNTSVPSFPGHAPKSTLCCSQVQVRKVQNTNKGRLEFGVFLHITIQKCCI